MLNNKSSNRNSGWKAGLVLPLLLAFMLAFNVKTEAKVLKDEADEIPLQENVVNVETEVLITKESTKEELDEIKETLKEYDIKANFSNINFNDGKITSIRMEYENEKNGTKGNIEKSDENGIGSFSFYFNDSGESGFRNKPETKVATSTKYRTVQNTPKPDASNIGENPLYVVNGEIYTARKLRGKYIVLESRAQFLNAEKAVAKYGDKAEGGAVIVPKGSIIRDMNKEMKKLQSNTSFSKRFISIGDNGKPNLLNLDKNNSQNSLTVFNIDDNNEPVTVQGKAGSVLFVGSDANNEPVKTYTVKGRATPGDSAYFKKRKIVYWTSNSNNKGSGYVVKRANDTTAPFHLRISQENQNVPAYQGKNSDQQVFIQKQKPLYVVDGKVIENFDSEDIEPEDIAAINVLKDKLAIKEYGEKGKNGVIVIHTKSSGYQAPDKKPEFVVFGIEKNDSDSKLESLEKSIMESTGMKVQFSGIERNSDNEITKIRVSAEKGDQKASASWDDTKGIPKITVGFSEKDGIYIKNL